VTEQEDVRNWHSACGESGDCVEVSFEDDIIKMQLENASDTISESDYGTHTLIVYPNLDILRKFYSYYVKKRVEERNEVIQLAPFYETEDSVRKSLSEGEISIDIEKWEKEEKSLIIVDSLKKYSDHDSPESDNNFNKNLGSVKASFTGFIERSICSACWPAVHLLSVVNKKSSSLNDLM